MYASAINNIVNDTILIAENNVLLGNWKTAMAKGLGHFLIEGIVLEKLQSNNYHNHGKPLSVISQQQRIGQDACADFQI